MAVLSDAERLAARAEFMSWWSGDSDPAVLNKTDLLAAIVATDAWTAANATGFNQALPQPARGVLSARQKAKLLTFVIARRFGVL